MRHPELPGERAAACPRQARVPLVMSGPQADVQQVQSRSRKMVTEKMLNAGIAAFDKALALSSRHQQVTAIYEAMDRAAWSDDMEAAPRDAPILGEGPTGRRHIAKWYSVANRFFSWPGLDEGKFVRWRPLPTPPEER